MTIEPADFRFLRDMARDVIDASRVHPNDRVGNSPRNTLGHTLIRPGGRDCYPAIWVRDFSLSLDTNLIPPDEIRQHLHLIATRQNGPAARKLQSGATIPPFAVPDHINFDGGPVFYPGTMSADEDQGGEPFGVLPPSDDHYEFIHIAYALWRTTEDTTFLNDVINGLPLRERLVRAFELPRTSDATGGMVLTADKNRAVGFGFHDAIYLTGSLLFASLLRYRAARELARLDIHPPATNIALTIASHFAKVFADPTGSGWLLAATETGRQPDVWGTCYALTLGVLAPDEARAARNAIIAALHTGTITCDGAVRHLPADHNWEKVAPGIPLNTYQNGAYWHTPTGWLIAAIQKYEPVLAQRIFADYIAHLREHDFRKGEKFGAPWECIGQDRHYRQNAVYMTSVTVPLAVIEGLK